MCDDGHEEDGVIYLDAMSEDDEVVDLAEEEDVVDLDSPSVVGVIDLDNSMSEGSPVAVKTGGVSFIDLVDSPQGESKKC